MWCTYPQTKEEKAGVTETASQTQRPKTGQYLNQKSMKRREEYKNILRLETEQ